MDSKLTDSCAWCTELSTRRAARGLFVQIMTCKFGSKIEDVEDRLNEFLELVRRYDEANGYRSRSRPSEKGVHYFERALACEDTSSVERQ